jgi:23S rRNA (pseudouridine1915-N3)-methyltransferase
MQIHLLAIGKKMPDWIEIGFYEYTRRLKTTIPLNLIEIATIRKSNSQDSKTVIREEGEKLLAAIPDGSWVIALDEHGKQWDSKGLAVQLEKWAGHSSNIALMIGGADGLDKACLDRADQTWSLSPLTLPHAMVRVVVAEQIYRAWSLNNNHPYHRS